MQNSSYVKQVLVRILVPGILVCIAFFASSRLPKYDRLIFIFAIWGAACGAVMRSAERGDRWPSGGGSTHEVGSVAVWIMRGFGAAALAWAAYSVHFARDLVTAELVGGFAGWLWYGWVKAPFKSHSSQPADPERSSKTTI